MTKEIVANNQKHSSVYDDLSVPNNLGSHVVLMSTCVRELTSKSNRKNPFFKLEIRILNWDVYTTLEANVDLAEARTGIESLKEDLAEVKDTVNALIEMMSNGI